MSTDYSIIAGKLQACLELRRKEQLVHSDLRCFPEFRFNEARVNLYLSYTLNLF